MDHLQDFHARLKRVSKNTQNGDTVVGPALTRAHQRNQRLVEMLSRHEQEGVHRARIEPRMKLTEILSYVLAFAMGGLAAIIARFLRFQLTGDAAQISQDMDLALDIIFAIVVAFILREAVSLSAVKRMGAQFAGILLAIVTMHNVVHTMPDVFSKMFSEDWVTHVTQTTDPGTLYFRGHSYHI